MSCIRQRRVPVSVTGVTLILPAETNDQFRVVLVSFSFALEKLGPSDLDNGRWMDRSCQGTGEW